MLADWTATAFNQVPHSPNQIHGDDLARQYGFKGGLVPGVTQSAYLCHPGLCAWSEDWLTRGAADIRVLAPLYDGEQFKVSVISPEADRYQAELRGADGRLCASGTISLAEHTANLPVRRGDPLAPADFHKPAATPDSLRELQRSGCLAFAYDWRAGIDMATYLKDPADMPALVKPVQGGHANTAFVLSCANWVLSDNAYMNPWVHMATRSQHYRPIPVGSRVITEMAVVDLFSRKGHEFVDVQVNLFGADDECYASIEQRAIYQLRGS